MHMQVQCTPLRVRLHLSDSASKSPFDSVHDLHTKGLGFQLVIRQQLQPLVNTYQKKGFKKGKTPCERNRTQNCKANCTQNCTCTYAASYAYCGACVFVSSSSGLFRMSFPCSSLRHRPSSSWTCALSLSALQSRCRTTPWNNITWESDKNKKENSLDVGVTLLNHPTNACINWLMPCLSMCHTFWPHMLTWVTVGRYSHSIISFRLYNSAYALLNIAERTCRHTKWRQ
jgi:hypothetical protein